MRHEWHHLYGHRWQQYRANYLRMHPLCVMCDRLGQATAATIVDHRVPHKGDLTLFWNPDNHQSLCKPHHDGEKQRMEHGTQLHGGDQHGQPADPNHHWNQP